MIILALLIAELAVILPNVYHLAQYSKANQKITPREISGEMEPDGERYVLTSPDNDLYTTVLVYDFGKIKKGTYDVSVNYEAEGTQRIAISAIPAAQYQPNEIILDHRLNNVNFTVSPDKSLNNMKLLVMHKGSGDFSIDLKLSRSRIGYVRNIITALFCFSLVEISVFLFLNHPDTAKTVFFLTLISGLAFLPYMLNGIAPGHDFVYHFMRIEALANELRNGQFPVYMESLWIGNYGYPAPLYYCDFFLYVPALLRLAGYSFNAAYKIFVLLTNVLTAFLSFISFRSIFGKKKIALVLTCAYVCAPYRLIDIYVRNAVGEYCAITFLPLICAGFFGIVTIEPDRLNNRDRFRPYVRYLSMGMTGVILSHVLTVEIVAMMAGIFCLLFVRKFFNLHRIVALLQAALQCILLSLIFTVPFLDFYFSNSLEINQSMNTAIPAIQAHGAQPGEFFMFFKSILGIGTRTTGWVDRLYLSAGLVLTFTVIAAIICVVCGRITKKLLTFTFLALLSFYLSSSLFPYDFLAQKSRLGVYFAQILFPWRFLTLASVFSALVLGELLMIGKNFLTALTAELPVRLVSVAATTMAFFLCFLVASETALFTSQYGSGTGRTVIVNTAEIEAGMATPFHILRSGTNIDLFTYQAEAENAVLLETEHQGTNWSLLCETGDVQGTINMPLLNYKGYRVTDEFGNDYEISDSWNKTIQFTLPAGFNGQVDIRFQPPLYWKVSALLSLLYMVYAVYDFRKLSMKNSHAAV